MHPFPWLYLQFNGKLLLVLLGICLLLICSTYFSISTPLEHNDDIHDRLRPPIIYADLTSRQTQWPFVSPSQVLCKYRITVPNQAIKFVSLNHVTLIHMGINSGRNKRI